MNMGCCGRRVTAMGLLQEADAYPPSHPRGAWARKKIAFSVVADKAKRAGNRAAYDRAMAGLRSLGDGPSTGYHGTTTSDAAAATRAFQALLTQTQARVDADLATASSYINIVLAAGQIGAGIGSALCNGCDRTGIDAVNLVISLVRAIITPGATLTLPTLSVDALNGLASFCAFKDAIKGVIQAGFGAGIGAASAARNAGAVTALTSIQNTLTGLMDSICNIPQVQTASCPANSTWDASANACRCSAGYSSALVPDQCLPVGPDGCPTNATRQANGTCSCNQGYSSAISPGQCLPNGTPMRPFILLRPGVVRPPLISTPPASGGGGGLVFVGAAAIAAKLLGFF